MYYAFRKHFEHFRKLGLTLIAKKPSYAEAQKGLINSMQLWLTDF